MKTNMTVKEKRAPREIRFLFRVTNRLHQEIKIRAAIHNVSMGQWITQVIVQKIRKEKKYEKEPKSS